MKRLIRDKLTIRLIKLIFILTVFLLFVSSSSIYDIGQTSAAAEVSPDAIGFRVIPNPDHLSPARWYQENIKLKGAPQALKVDGYEAARDGRTTYVNAANVVEEANRNKFYTNIYIISYNQQAENQTVDIFGQILAHWKFNANLTAPGVCSRTSAKTCLYSGECPSGEYCQSPKAIVIRDTKRLADLADIKLALIKYQTNHNGAYPELAAGSYLAGKSISKWPSWQATLGAALGITMPLDPVNKLGDCLIPPGYNPNTCWNEKDKKFADPSDNGEFNLPDNSRAYVYQHKADGSYALCALMESRESDYSNLPQDVFCSSSGASQSPITINCGALNGYEGIPFTGFVSADYSGSGALTWRINPLRLSGWPSDLVIQNTPESKQKRLWAQRAGAHGDYSVEITVENNLGASVSEDCQIKIGYCGDSVVNGGGETCDRGAGNTDTCEPGYNSTCDYCDSDCHLQTVAAPFCGDCLVNGTETCDDGNTNNGDGCSGICTYETRQMPCARIPASAIFWNNNPLFRITQTYNGVSWTPDNTSSYSQNSAGGCSFYCDANYTWDNTAGACVGCGDGARNGTEECDDGGAINGDGCSSICRFETRHPNCVGVLPANSVWNNSSQPPDGTFTQTYNGTSWQPASMAISHGDTVGDCHYTCAPTYSWDNISACIKCGDGTVNGTEQCDDGNQNDNDICSNDCTQGCGNGIVNTDETCDDRNNINDDACRNDCHFCGDGAVDIGDGEECDPAGSTTGCSTEAATPCGNMIVQGNKTCQNNCRWNSCQGFQPTIEENTSTLCNTTNKPLTDYACCILTKCSQDGCACCGRGPAPLVANFTSTSTMNVSWESWSSRISITTPNGWDPGRCSASSGVIPIPASSPIQYYSCQTAAGCGQYKTASDLSGNCTLAPGQLRTTSNNCPTASCRLSQDLRSQIPGSGIPTSTLRNWYVSTDDSTAYYKCWK